VPKVRQPDRSQSQRSSPPTPDRHQPPANGGSILDTEYRGVAFEYTWSCKLNHRWRTTASIVKTGSWCPQCATSAKMKQNHEEKLRAVAACHGGRLLSDKYLGCHRHLLWECAVGHRWSQPVVN
jgi:hypothetical protein